MEGCHICILAAFWYFNIKKPQETKQEREDRTGSLLNTKIELLLFDSDLLS